jgi:hypothetical protein
MKIGLDLDGVIIDHASSKILKAKELGYNIKPCETLTHLIKKILTPEHYKELQTYIYGRASLNAPAMESAIEYIKKIASENEIFIISCRNISDGGDKLGLEWLKKNAVLNHITKEKIFFVPHDDVYAKNVAAKKLGIEIYLDDQLKILKEMSNVKTRVLFDQYDVSSPSLPYFKVISWPEFADFVRKLKQNC